MFNPLKIFKKKDSKNEERRKMLLEKYNNGEILVVDGKTDNVAYLKSKEVENGSEEVAE